MVSAVYFSTVMFVILFAFIIYNTYKYVYGQSKWRTIPLLFFYILAFITVGYRIYDTIYIMQLAEQFTIPTLFIPPVLKMCIGMIQVLVMIEISVHVDQNFKEYNLEV